MRSKLTRFFRHLSARRGIALALGPGLLTLGIDAAISHLAGKELRTTAQLIPVLFAPAACLALIAAAAPIRKLGAFRAVVRAVGTLATLVGALGVAFHARVLLQLLEGVPLCWRELEAALAVAPPIFAPAAFAGIGALVWILGSPRLSIRYQLGRAPVPAAPLPRLTEQPA